MDVKFELTELLDKGEEEENNGKESVIDQEFKIFNQSSALLAFDSIEKNKDQIIYLGHYQNDYVRKVSPPPELTV